jgi:uncharacterized protein (TIGR02453 family)
MARSGFPGFPAEGIEFFAKLMRNNRREWFQPRKETFETQLKQPMRELVEALNGELRRLDPEYVTDPDKAIYRIYRDTRFAKDKTPYKDHIAASFYRKGGTGHGLGGYYCAVSHKEVAVGGGIYMPEPETLAAIRSHIAENHQELRKILRAKAVRELFGDLQGEQLTRVPKGYLPDHPAADLLRFKRYILYVELPADLATTPQLYPEIVKRFRALTPFQRFLSAAVAPTRKKPDATRFFTEM